MASPSSHRNTDDDFPIEELIFSCSICQATVSDVYATTESNKGFHSGSGDENGIVTKLWIAECSHVTCAKHLEGEAAPLHPKDAEPRAACPRCIQTSGDNSPKALYAIRGLGEGEYDATISAEWRRCPAIKLDTAIPGMEAVRFQYMALVHYARRIRKHSQEILRKLETSEAAFSKERKQRRQLQSDVMDFESRLERFEEVQSKLEMWESRKPKIYHYLGIFGEMMKEIHGNRALLRSLGYQVAEKSYAFPGDEVAQAEHAIVNQRADPVLEPGVRGAAAVATGAAETSSSAKKRKHGTSAHNNDRPAQRARGSSRDVMPPPLARTGQSHYVHSHQAAAPGLEHAPLPTTYPQHDSQLHYGQQLPYRPPRPEQQSSRTIQQPLRQRQEEERGATYQGQYPHASQAFSARQFEAPVEDLRCNRERPAQPQTTSRYASLNGFHNTIDDPRVTSYDDAYGSLAEQDITQIRRRPQLMSTTAYEPNRISPTTDHMPYKHQVPQTQAAVIRSPFFKAGSAYTRPDTVRTPTRGSYSIAQDGPARPEFEIRALAQPSFSTGLRLSEENYPKYRSPQGHPEHQQQRDFVLPQTPRNAGGFLQRPDRPPPTSASYAPGQPQTTMSRTRVSLPPNKGRMAGSSYASQDGALLRIQGVRGLSSQQGQPPAYAQPQAFGMSRQLFSAADGRRSVRR